MALDLLSLALFIGLDVRKPELHATATTTHGAEAFLDTVRNLLGCERDSAPLC